MTIVNSMLIICYIIVANASSSSIFYAKFQYIRQLTEYMSIYNWNEIPFNETEPLLATLVWDELQTNGCCGLFGFVDWVSIRPLDLPSQYFPRSCCKLADELYQGRGPFCSLTHGVYSTGCVEQAEQYWSNSKTYYIFYITSQMMLACISWNLGSKIKANKPNSNQVDEDCIQIQMSARDSASSLSVYNSDVEISR